MIDSLKRQADKAPGSGWPWLCLVPLLLSSLSQQAPAQIGGGPVNIQVAEVQKRPILREVQLTGTIVPKRYSLVSAEVSGKVQQLYVDEGDFVEDGQPLLDLRATPTELELAEAEANLALANAQLQELLNGTREEDIQINRAEVAATLADLERARSEEGRLAELLATNTISQSEYDQAKAAFDRLSAVLQRRQAELDKALKGARDEAIASARARVSAAEATVARLEDELERLTVRAPFSGVIGQKFIEAGQWVSPGDEVFSLAEIDVLRVDVQLPERYLPDVRQGASVSLMFTAYPDRHFEAPVETIIPLGSQISRTFTTRIEIDNKDRLLAPGMFARVQIPLGDPESVEESILVPKDAIVLSGGDSRTVWVVEEGEEGLTATSREVETGQEYRGMIQITSGNLEKGQTIVVRGNENLTPGNSVRILQDDGQPGDEPVAQGSEPPRRQSQAAGKPGETPGAEAL